MRFCGSRNWPRGSVAAIYTLDAQVSYRLTKLNLVIKAGGTNVTNQPCYTFIGGPAVGGLSYTNLI
jgi:hypothetical protein